MRFVVVAFALAFAVAVSAEELTVPEVIAAHRAGAPVEGILRLVREASSVAVLAAADLERLHTAGVPQAVIDAMAARHAAPSPTPAPTGSEADDGRLRGRGIPETVVATPTKTPTPPAPSPISTTAPPAILAVVPTPLPTQTPAVALVFEPLVRLTGAFRKAQAGRLVLTAETLEWFDAGNSSRGVRIPASSLEVVWLSTTQRGQGAPLVELRVRAVGGEDVTFRDIEASAEAGLRVPALYRAIREHFPQIVLPEKPAR